VAQLAQHHLHHGSARGAAAGAILAAAAAVGAATMGLDARSRVQDQLP
jgi:hypothetical protein